MKQALSKMLSSVSAMNDTVKKPLLQAVGCISASDIISPINVPSFPRSAMDGYAVFYEDIINASEDTPAELEVVCEIDAGGYAERSFSRGECTRVMTGAYIPGELDCVVKQEDTDMGKSRVRIFRSAGRYMNYCKAGEDIVRGQCMLRKGSIITSFSAGVLASAGITEISVRRPLKIALISTGTELQTPGAPLADGRIYNSIQYVIASQIKEFGFECVSMKNIPDDAEMMKASFLQAVSEADILITTGGLSVGRKDIVGKVLRDSGAEIIFGRSDNPLGNPVMFSLLNGKYVLSLSGTPYAAIANFDYYFRPLASKLMESDAFLAFSEQAVAENEYLKVRPFIKRLRGYCSDGRVKIFSGSKNSAISDLAACNCFVDVDEGNIIHAGDIVRVTYFGRKQWI